MKTCNRCGAEKEIEEFGLTGRNTCLRCENQRKRESVDRRKKENPDAWIEKQRAYDHKRNLRRYFGITPEDYQKLLEDQQGACKTCGIKPPTIKLAVDHDRACCPGRNSCGKCVRGLLCVQCNTTLGLLKENPITINNLLKYVKEYKCN